MERDKLPYLNECLSMAILKEDERIISTSIEELEDLDELKKYVGYLRDRRALWQFERFPAFANGISSNQYTCNMYEKAAAFRKYIIDHDENMIAEWDRKLESHKWDYQGNGIYVFAPDLMHLYVESNLRENDLWEYSMAYKKYEIVVFVFTHSSIKEPTCYFRINVRWEELISILGVNNTVLTDNQHRLMAKDYCDSIGIKISEWNEWIGISS